MYSLNTLALLLLSFKVTKQWARSHWVNAISTRGSLLPVRHLPFRHLHRTLVPKQHVILLWASPWGRHGPVPFLPLVCGDFPAAATARSLASHHWSLRGGCFHVWGGSAGTERYTQTPRTSAPSPWAHGTRIRQDAPRGRSTGRPRLGCPAPMAPPQHLPPPATRPAPRGPGCASPPPPGRILAAWESGKRTEGEGGVVSRLGPSRGPQSPAVAAPRDPALTPCPGVGASASPRRPRHHFHPRGLGGQATWVPIVLHTQGCVILSNLPISVERVKED